MGKINQKLKTPIGWKSSQVSELVQEQPKSTIKVDDASLDEVYPFFTSGEPVLTYSKYLVDGENIFIATGGVANIKYHEGKASYSSDTYVVNTQRLITKLFFYYLVKDLEYINYAYFLGSGLKHLQKNDFKKHKVIYPQDQKEQQKIVEILTTIDEAIDKTDAIIKKNERTKKGLMQDLFKYGIDEKGRIRSEKTHKFKTVKVGNKEFRMPEEWDIKSIGNILTLQRGFDLPVQERQEGSYFVLGSNGIDGMHNAYSVKAPCVVTGRSGTIGEVYYYNKNCWPLNTTLYVKDFHGNDSEFIFRFLISIKLKQFSISTGVPTLNRNFVHPEIKPFPGLKEQRQIVQVLNLADEKIKQEKLYKEKLIKIKIGLIEGLLTGAVPVKHLLK